MSISGATAPLRRLTEEPLFRRLFACIAGALVLGVMSGPDGSATAPLSGLTGSLGNARIFWFLGIGLVIFGLMTVRERFGSTIRKGSDRLLAAPRRLFPDRRVRGGVYVALLAVAIIYPIGLNAYWQEVFVDQIGVYVLLALGLNMVVGFAGLLDLGYIAFFAIGMYTTAYLTGALPVHLPFHLNPFFTIPFAILAATLAGVLLGAPTLRLRGDYLAIVTLGFGEITQIVATNLTGVTGGAQGVIGIPHFSVHLAGVSYKWGLASLPYYYLLLGFIVVVLVAFSFLKGSRIGRSWAAIREDEIAAEASGVHVLKYKVMAFAIGASVSGFAGAIEISKIGFVEPGDFTVQTSILILVLVIFGGMGSLPGAVVGAAVLQWFPAWVRVHPIRGFQVEDLYLYLGALLILMMIFRPVGILPSRQRKREVELSYKGVIVSDALSDPEARAVTSAVADDRTAAPSTEDPIVEVRELSLSFGGLRSLSEVSLTQRRGEILSVIGPNGAGKTSLFNCLTGVYHPQEGSITFHPTADTSTEVIGMRPHRVNHLGIARTFQTSRLFSALTTFENVKVGVEGRQRGGPVGAMLRLPRTRREERESDQKSSELLEFVGLADKANLLSSSLPYGDQRRLEIARALGTGPSLLLLDEPAAGTNPSEKAALAQLIRRVNTELGVSVLLIEHDMALVMSIAERIVVLNFGVVIASGTTAEVQRDPTVIEAYLGAPAVEEDDQSSSDLAHGEVPL